MLTWVVTSVQMVYSSLPNFEEKEEDFRAESVLLRRRFTDESMLSTSPNREDFMGAMQTTASRWLKSGCVAYGNSLMPQKSAVYKQVVKAGRPEARQGVPKAIGWCADEDTLVRVSRDKLPGDALALSLQKVWEVIRDQKDLNLPAHKVQRPRQPGPCCLLWDYAITGWQGGQCKALAHVWAG